MEQRAYRVVQETVVQTREVIESRARRLQAEEVELERELQEMRWAEQWTHAPGAPRQQAARWKAR